MRTEKQIEVFFYKRSRGGKVLFLLMKRTPERGGFWQPLSGGIEEGETFEETIKREAEEETGIKQFLRLVNADYSYEFTDEGRPHVEYVFGAEVADGTSVLLSREHDEFRWVSKDEALTLLKWPGNKKGLKRLDEKLGV